MISLSGFVRKCMQLYYDGSRMNHYMRVREGEGDLIPTTPATPFVYEYFLYNSLFSLDWQKSIDQHSMVYYNRKEEPRVQEGDIRRRLSRKKRGGGEPYVPEGDMQDAFEDFLKTLAARNAPVLYKEFSPLADMCLEEADWMAIDEDDYVTLEQGRKFFADLRSLQALVKQSKTPDKQWQQLDKVFVQIKECRGFVYRARNSIFHGSTMLGSIGSGQKKRIEVYRSFLGCLLKCFFSLATDPTVTTL